MKNFRKKMKFWNIFYGHTETLEEIFITALKNVTLKYAGQIPQKSMISNDIYSTLNSDIEINFL